jgi:HK97 family phage major capsid protein
MTTPRVKRRPSKPATLTRRTPTLALAEFENLARAGLEPEEILGTPAHRVAKLAAIEARVAPVAGERCVDFTISTGALDRYNSTIAVNGWQLESFKRNPVVLWGHDDAIPAIARAENTRIEGGQLKSTARFAERDVHPLADTIFRLIEGKFIGAASVGWIPLKYRFSEDQGRNGGIDYLERELLEWSVVNIPANSDCLSEARSLGINTKPLIAWCERAIEEGTGNMSAVSLNAMRRAAGARPVFGSRAVSENVIPIRSGFRTFGEHLQAIGQAFKAGVRAPDQRLVRMPTGAGEVDPSGGGFLVDTQWATELVGFAYEEAVLPSLCDRRDTKAPLADVRVPAIDETSRADGSRWGGALAYWLAEASTIPATMPRYKNLAFSAKKLVLAVFVTDELLADAPMLEAHVRRVFSAELGFKLDLAILNGDGAGKPLGMLNAPCLIQVPKETGQAATTLVARIVLKLWSRLPAPSRRRAIWLVNEDLEEQLDQMSDVIGTSGVTSPSAGALYMPAGAGGNPYPLLKGRPVLAIEQCPVLGQVGDIVLADPAHYVLIDGGVNPVLSVHVHFLDDQSVWRFVLRVDGQPAFASPITPYNGSANTRSPFVALAAR